MFKLLRSTLKRDRGTKVVEQCTYVGITLFGVSALGIDLTVAIDLMGAKERYTLCIPPEKLVSVIERLQECQARLEKQQADHYARLLREATQDE